MSKRAGKRPTIRDVAAVAGVSRGTVSRVINGGHWVSPEAREKVESAIARTGYVVSHSARSLATGRAGSIGFLLTEPQQLLFEDPNFSILYRAAAAALAKVDLPLVLMVAGTESERTQVLRYIGAGHVDGVLLISSHEGNPVVASLLDAGVPTVACGRPLGYEDRMGWVAADDRTGGRAMTRHLLERGCHKLGMVTGPPDTSGGSERYLGFVDAMTEAGIAVDPSLVVHGDYSRASGNAGAAELLARHEDLDGIFVASDLMAAGALEVLRHAGRRVPDEVVVGGFDDSGLAATLEPPLTTMRQPFTRISEEMVRLLLGVIDGEDPASIVLPTTLVERASTARG
ncbi:LacI family DNA-binding transcriptional regulator [Actinomyces sp. MRS3W]|uniref:LacI family DNA-binding transcriptional regulator n=1 Tax=Actinomyces sp. MRS3W TaxID=2800796 RepID=UPI0028FD2118|nr:LacI family DNA-binding transcriptional regulator [Actinomyces sp. MRS3W]MDU0348033.1 LacI family DNA-binding transcriptional regulator [Actinomyces sp. MRS3W]